MEQSNSRWVKNNPNDKVWWLHNPCNIGAFVFSFNKKDKFNLYRDYPQKLTKEQKEIFDKENPFWKEYFRKRSD